MYSVFIELVIHIFNFTEAFLMVRFLINFFEFKAKQKDRILNRVLILFLLWGSIELGLLFQIGDVTITFVEFFILLLYCNKFLKGNFIYHSIAALILLLLVPLIQVTALQIFMILEGVSLKEYIDISNPSYLFGIAIVRFLYFVILEVYLKFKKKWNIFFDKKYGIIYALILAYSIFLEGFIFYSLQKIPLNAYTLGLLALSCGAIGIDIFIVYSIYKISEKQQQEDKIKILQLQNTYQEQQIREVQFSEKQVSRLKHDYRNSISNIRELIRKNSLEEALDYLNQLEGYYVRKQNEYFHTGNSLIDVILNTKSNICDEYKIEFSSCIIGDFDKIDGFKISIILSNLLDNAIESEQKEKHKEIYFEMKMKGEYLSCIIKNAINHSILKENPELRTTKKNNPEHGIGLKHIKELINDLDGFVEFFEMKNFFHVHFMIPISMIKLQNK